MNPRSDRVLHTGNAMPVLGLGTWQLTRDTTETVEEALRLGYRMVDTAVDYGTQPAIGAAIRRSGRSRDELYVVTKVEENEDAYQGTCRDLEQLDLGHADLVLVHRPPATGAGIELWEGLIRARDDGLARDIGVSNYSVAQIEKLLIATGEPPAVNQIEWTPFGWSAELLDYCRHNGVVMQSYSPLTRAQRLSDRALTELAQRRGKSPAQVVLRWNLQLGVVPLPKANQHRHLVENIDVFDFELSEADMSALNALDERWSALGPTLQYL